MKIIHKYVLREHAGPLTFALTALTSLLLLNYIAKQFGQLVGKGLPWQVIGEFFFLSLPFTFAMTLPMAVLIAVLYAFSRLAAENEVTALRASGVGMGTLITPVVLASTFLALYMVYFNDHVLPNANHRLSVLQGDIARKKPTFALRAQVINEVSPGQFYIRANHLDEFSNRMREVTIYDLSDALRWRTIVADSGTMELAPNGKDLQMKLFNGYMQEVPRNEPAQFQRLYYVSDRIRIANVANRFESDTEGGIKSDREMSICELQDEVAAGERQYAIAKRDLEATLVAITREATTGAPAQMSLVIPPPSTGNMLPTSRADSGKGAPPPSRSVGRLYCALVDRVRQLLTGQPVTVATLHAAELPPHLRDAGHASLEAQDTTRRDSTRRDSTRAGAQPPDSTRRAAAPVTAREVPRPPTAQSGAKPPQPVIRMESNTNVVPATPAPAPLPAPLPTPGDTVTPGASPTIVNGQPVGASGVPNPISATSAIEASRTRMVEGRSQMNNNAVELHKKFALSAAVTVFVLLGAPLALRFPRGGVGFVIGASLLIFAIYYVGLIGGEPLGNEGYLPAWLAMWLPNIIFTLVAILMLSRMGRESSTARGGDVTELFATVRGALARPFRRAPRPVVAPDPGGAD